ncbi:ras-related protein Rab-37 isoform X3 [Leptinotarsa decemlineata]|uniref:ras-related protein Rab-37 isoform X3 n=1 Tax=Leptinotarsa decemlineata TaxID=7539 RepID=UPI003D30AD27
MNSDNCKKTVKVRSKQHVGNEPSEETLNSEMDGVDDEEVDPFTKKRRESLKNDVYDICGKTKVVAVDNTKVKLQIWDTAGQERFRSVTHAYYRDAHALLLLYDVTNKTSFDNIRAWLGEIREYAQDDVVIMLLGNKADCGHDRTVRREDGERLAREYNVAFMETSAKSGQNVDLAFVAVARELKHRQNGQKDANTFNVQDYVRQQTEKPQCPPCYT